MHPFKTPFLALALTLSACGRPGTGSATMAATGGPVPAPVVPRCYPSRVPSGPDTVASGPITALCIDDTGGEDELDITYQGYLYALDSDHSLPLHVGVVQNGQTVYVASMSAPQLGDLVTSYIPLASLKSGDIGLYLYDDQGRYDSDEGQNYHVTLP